MGTDNCGIYKISSSNNNFYIGSSRNIKERWRRHKKDFKANTHSNIILKRAWDKYKDNLKFEKILICRPEDLLFYEQLCLDNFKPIYNIAKTAGAANLGLKASLETRQKMSKARKGKKFSPEWCANMSKAKLGKIVTPETRAKISATLRSRKVKAA